MFEKLSSSEKSVVLQCFRATLAFIDPDEFQTRLGITPEELQREIDLWPTIDDSDGSGNEFIAVNNCLNEVCNGFRVSPEEWPRWFDVSHETVIATYRKWLRLHGIHGGLR